MKRYVFRAALCAALLSGFGALLVGTLAAPVRVPARDANVQTIVSAVSAARLEETVRGLAAFPTRHTLSGAGNVEAAALWLEKQFAQISRETGGRLQVKRDTWTQPAGTRLPAPHELTNVVAVLPGTAIPERVLIVSGHYDSRVTDVMDAKSPAPGANDDASGVAVVLECARLLAGSSRRFPATVVFACVTGEEQGLYGATHLASQMTNEKRSVVAMLTNDIVGNSRGENGVKNDREVRVFSAGYDPTETPAQAARRRAWGTDADTPARTLARAVHDAARRYVPRFAATLVYRNDRYGRGGDHTPFVNAGFAAVRLTEPNEDWRHQHQNVRRAENNVVYGDLPEFVDYRYLARVTQVNAAILAELASAPPAPTNVSLAGDLSANTTLSWDPPTDAAAVEVLWRRTTAPGWEGSRLVPAGQTRFMLPLSKDDYLFGVRAVGASGARSLPTIPVAGPAR
jgi:Zn-dependent M28 family amino/carboxypeptidase